MGLLDILLVIGVLGGGAAALAAYLRRGGCHGCGNCPYGQTCGRKKRPKLR